MKVWVRRDGEHVVLGIVAPKIAQGSDHGQERDLVDWCRPPDWSSMFWVVRSVPNDTRDAGLLYNFASGRFDSGKLNAAVRFVIFGQGFSSPPGWMVWVSLSKNNPRVPYVS